MEYVCFILDNSTIGGKNRNPDDNNNNNINGNWYSSEWMSINEYFRAKPQFYFWGVDKNRTDNRLWIYADWFFYSSMYFIGAHKVYDVFFIAASKGNRLMPFFGEGRGLLIWASTLEFFHYILGVTPHHYSHKTVTAWSVSFFLFVFISVLYFPFSLQSVIRIAWPIISVGTFLIDIISFWARKLKADENGENFGGFC